MKIIKSVTTDLVNKGVGLQVEAVQSDGCVRALELHLTENGRDWAVPAGVTAAVAFKKPDGTSGLYDTLPNGSAAVSISGSTVTAALAPQALTCPGRVMAAVVLCDGDLNRIATFPFAIEVAPDPAAGKGVSNDYYNYKTMADVNAAMDAVVDALAVNTAAMGALDTFNRRNLIKEYRLYHWSSGKLSTNANCRHTDPIFLRKGEVVYGTNVYKKYGALTSGFLVAEDGLTTLSPLTAVKPVENNADVAYFTFNPIPVTGFWSFNTAEGGCITKDPAWLDAPAGVYLPEDVLDAVRPGDLTAERVSCLAGKRASFNGDSICAGAGFAGGYGKLIADKYGMEYENVARGGGTVTAETYVASTGNPRHWICRTIESMNADADYAIIEGGVNDASLGLPLGEISAGYSAALDDTTFCGAFESMLKQLITRFAGKKYGYIAVHQMANAFRVTNEAEGSYYWAAKQCCEKWGVPFLDLNGTVPPFNFFTAAGDPALYALCTAYTHNGDGWHPNEAGYDAYYVPKIAKWMESL